MADIRNTRARTREAAMAGVRQELATTIGPRCHWRRRWRDEEALLSEPHHETCEVDHERAESTERCKTSNPALWGAERKQVARLTCAPSQYSWPVGSLIPKRPKPLWEMARTPFGQSSGYSFEVLWARIWSQSVI